MLKPKSLSPKVSTDAAPQRSAFLPSWAILIFWLALILLAATALGLVASYGLERRASRERSPLTTNPLAKTTIAQSSQPKTTRPPQTPAPLQPAGVLIVTPTSTPLTRSEPATATTAPTSQLPPEVLLREVPIGKQTRPLNCEFQSAADLAWYYGRPVTWEDIYQYVGHDVNGNPHAGFVGRSFDDQPGQLYPLGYGVYAEPIARALVELGLNAEVSYNQSPEWLMAQLAAGHPVMVWATSNMAIHPVATWTAADGVTVKGVPGEHTYLAVGYDAAGLWLIDPWDGQRHQFTWETFLQSWDLLDRMALLVTGPPGAVITPSVSQ